MSPLPAPGAKAPSFTLGDADGRLHRFDDVSAHPATLLLFFKRDCATCDLTAPVVERIVQTLSPVGLNVLAVSQSSPVDTAAFTRRHGLTLPVVLDRELDVSQAYGFDAVPALVLTAADRTVLTSFEGWSKADFQELVSQAATLCNVASPAFEADDQPSARLHREFVEVAEHAVGALVHESAAGDGGDRAILHALDDDHSVGR